MLLVLIFLFMVACVLLSLTLEKVNQKIYDKNLEEYQKESENESKRFN